MTECKTFVDWVMAARTGNYDILEGNIQKYKQQQDRSGRTALMWAVFEGFVECVAFLVKYEAGVKDHAGMTALMYAVAGDKLECVKLLLVEIGQVHNHGYSALHIACVNGYFECAKLLLTESNLLSNDGKSPLQVAREHGRHSCTKLIEAFLANSEPTDKVEKSESKEAPSQPEVQPELRKRGASFSMSMLSKDSNKNLDIPTFVDWVQAARTGRKDILEANIQKFKFQQDRSGRTALMWAVFESNIDCVAFLAKHEQGMKDHAGLTALMYAVSGDKAECVQLLLGEMGLTHNLGFSALHIACVNGYFECAKLLLQESSIVSTRGRTPLQVAQERGRHGIARLIENYISQQSVLQVQKDQNQKSDLQQKENEVEKRFEKINQRMDVMEKTFFEFKTSVEKKFEEVFTILKVAVEKKE